MKILGEMKQKSSEECENWRAKIESKKARWCSYHLLVEFLVNEGVQKHKAWVWGRDKEKVRRGFI